MSWETRKGNGAYYTRSRRRRGHIIREYVGTGEAGELAAKIDARKRRKRRAAEADRRRRSAEAESLDSEVAEACRAIELFARAALVVAGYRRHHRGEWRKRREKTSAPA